MREAPARGRLKRQEKADEPVERHPAPIDCYSRNRRFAGSLRMARPGLEPGTPRFSVVCSTRTGDTTIFSRAVLASEFARFAGLFDDHGASGRVRAFPDFAVVYRMKRPTTRFVGLFDPGRLRSRPTWSRAHTVSRWPVFPATQPSPGIGMCATRPALKCMSVPPVEYVSCSAAVGHRHLHQPPDRQGTFGDTPPRSQPVMRMSCPSRVNPLSCRTRGRRSPPGSHTRCRRSRG